MNIPEKYSCKKNRKEQKRTDVLNCGYTFLSIHDIICLTGRKISAVAGSICFSPVWQRKNEGSEHDRMNEVILSCLVTFRNANSTFEPLRRSSTASLRSSSLRTPWSILSPTRVRAFLAWYLVVFGVLYTRYCGLYGLYGRDKTGWIR